MSKGSSRRKSTVEVAEMTARWALAFGNPDAKERKRLERLIEDIERGKHDKGKNENQA